MSKKWIDGDSARVMTNKYNQTVQTVEELGQNIDTRITSQPVGVVADQPDEIIDNIFKSPKKSIL